MAATAIKVSLGDIPRCNWSHSDQVGHFNLAMHHADTFKMADGLPTGDKHDEASVNACAKRARFGSDKFIVVVSHLGMATAIYQEGEKIA